MPSPQNSSFHPLVVGTVHSPGALRCALRLKAGAVDVLELRVDAFAGREEELFRAARRLQAPLLLTVRHPAEGGAGGLSRARRKELFGQFLPLASWMDLEVRSVAFFKAEISAARERGVRLIVSDHHFGRTPPLAFLRERVRRARAAGAEVFKLATAARSAGDLERLLAFLREGAAGTRAVMGMGELGLVSRLVLGRCGSVLNYGYLDSALVPGQWEATELKKRLGELFSERTGPGANR
jgi:3-dehydroquinate dehydratase-1